MIDHFRRRRLVYGLILFFITLTGFAQMPIFARYYISDIPGLGCLARFYVTHAVHYNTASLLLVFGVYVGLDLLHLLFCMVLLGATAYYTRVRRRTWIQEPY